ncbi:hypothetical protein J3R83DRAFT_2572 [Lanmaoa asiatica]|nr:hypothetical protein J3R83DRAFT_2572 [Lanmaoa asiatica]
MEYADLVFDARCHGCGKTARTVLWFIRRRYCSDCKLERLIDLSSCDKIIRDNKVLNPEELTIEKKLEEWVDIDQMESFLDEYHESSDKAQFLEDQQKQCKAIYHHAFECESWRDKQERERRKKLALRRKERDERIFERLEQHGYGPEIEHLGQRCVRDSNKSLFRKSKPLTDREWALIWPEWLKIMENFRSQRLEEVVYPLRRDLLATEYNTYVTHPTPDTPAFDLLPHVDDVCHLPPFRDIIRAPEGTQMNDKPFASAFAQLPALVDEWRKKLDAEIPALVKIPSCLSSGNVSIGQVAASSGTTSTESPQTDKDKLHLACALFRVCHGSFTYPEVFSLSARRYHLSLGGTEDDSERTGSIENQFSIRFVNEAPYIVHTCGLDPNVATADDIGPPECSTEVPAPGMPSR